MGSFSFLLVYLHSSRWSYRKGLNMTISDLILEASTYVSIFSSRTSCAASILGRHKANNTNKSQSSILSVDSYTLYVPQTRSAVLYMPTMDTDAVKYAINNTVVVSRKPSSMPNTSSPLLADKKI